MTAPEIPEMGLCILLGYQCGNKDTVCLGAYMYRTELLHADWTGSKPSNITWTVQVSNIFFLWVVLKEVFMYKLLCWDFCRLINCQSWESLFVRKYLAFWTDEDPINYCQRQDFKGKEASVLSYGVLLLLLEMVSNVEIRLVNLFIFYDFVWNGMKKHYLPNRATWEIFCFIVLNTLLQMEIISCFKK